MDTAGIYQGALMEHNAYPDHKHELDHATCRHRGINPSCGDDITIALRVTNGVVEEAGFTGQGCAISQASADIMADVLEGKTVDQARELIAGFAGLMRGEALDPALQRELGEALELEGVSRLPARVKCAMLSWRTAEHLLQDLDAAAQEGASQDAAAQASTTQE